MATPTSTTVYGRIVSNTSKSVIKSKVDKLTGFKYPLEATPLRGTFSKQTGKNLVMNMINSLLKTYKGERFMLPNYGCNLADYLMEPLDETTFNDIRDSIAESITDYLKLITINKLQVFQSEPSFRLSNVLNVKLFCTIKDEENNNLEVNIKI